MSGLLSVVGLGLPLSATDGPVAPPPAVVLMGSLDLVRRDLERMSDGLLAGDTQQITTNTLIIDAPSNESVPVVLDGTSDSAAADIQAPATTASERTTAFHNEQAQRIAAFAEEQSARISTFTEEVTAQFAESPLTALIGIPVFVATECAGRGIRGGRSRQLRFVRSNRVLPRLVGLLQPPDRRGWWSRCDDVWRPGEERAVLAGTVL